MQEKNKEYYIKLFIRFLKSKDLLNRFYSLFRKDADLNKKLFKSIDNCYDVYKYLIQIECEDFIFGAFSWSLDSDVDWCKISVEWITIYRSIEYSK